MKLTIALAVLAVLAHGYVVEDHLKTHDQFTLTAQFCFGKVKDKTSLFH